MVYFVTLRSEATSVSASASVDGDRPAVRVALRIRVACAFQTAGSTAFSGIRAPSARLARKRGLLRSSL